MQENQKILVERTARSAYSVGFRGKDFFAEGAAKAEPMENTADHRQEQNRWGKCTGISDLKSGLWKNFSRTEPRELNSQRKHRILGGSSMSTKPAKGINLSISLAYPMLISPSFLRYPSVVITGWYRYCSIAKVLYKQRIETTY